MTRHKLTAEDYDEMAADYAEHPPTADEITRDIEVFDPVALKKGRPRRGRKSGETPILSVRFPDDVRDRINDRAEKDGTAAAEVIRRAVVEYLDAS